LFSGYADHQPKKVAILADQGPAVDPATPVTVADAGINFVFKDDAVLDGLVVINAYSWSSAVVAQSQIGMPPPAVRLVNCLFVDVTPIIDIQQGLHGGAVTNNGARLQITHCTFYRCNSWYNDINYNPAPICTVANLSGELLMTNSIVWDPGGAVYHAPISPAPVSGSALHVTVAHSIIQGGAFGAWSTDPMLSNIPAYENSTTLLRGRLTPLSTAAFGTAGTSDYPSDLFGELRPDEAADLGPEQWINSFRDNDNDGIIDQVEMQLFGSTALDRFTDTDGDSLSDYLEVTFYNTNRTLIDTNGDGVLDGFLGSFASPDQDADGLTNAQEAALGTDPLKADTDGDGHADGTDPYPLNAMLWTANAPNPLDTTPPVLTLDEPLDATLLP
jgi:hypothetical protein